MAIGTGRDVLDLLLRGIDRFNPPGLASDSRLRARLITTFSLSVLFWIPLLAGVLFAISAGPTAAAVGLFGMSTASAPIALRRFGIGVGANVAAGAAMLTILSASVMNGGPDLNTHTILAIVPVVAVSLSGMKGAVSWTVVVLCATVGLYVFDLAGFPFPEDIPIGYRWAFQMVAACAFATTLVGIVLMYEYTRDQVAAALQAGEADLSGIVETAPDGLLVIDSQGRLRRVNPAAERLFGAPAARLIGASVEFLFPHGLQLRDGVVLSDVRSRCADGRSFPADLAVGRLADVAGERYVVIVRDVSTRHESERVIADARDRAIQASRAKSTFLANMSHELRTPLNAILGYAELVGEEIDLGAPENAQEDLAKIGAAGRHLLSLIDHLLDLSKIEAGKLVLERTVVQVTEVLEEVLTTIRPLIASRGNALVFEMPEGLGTIVNDPLRLHQALSNLMSNAAKFTERGVVTLRVVRVPATASQVERIRFQVADTGIGMSLEQRGRIFDDFVQADTSTTRRFGGTGLGLSITRRIVRMMGGDVTVESELGVGSTFTMEIPTQPTSPTVSTSLPPLVRGGVLIIDEDGWTRDVLARTLGRAGIPVAVAPTADAGFQLAVTLRPKVVVLDMLHPGREAWDVLKRLREHPVTAAIPVVVVTVGGDDHLALAMGASYLVENPLERDQLLEVVRRLLGTRVGHALVVEDDDALRDILTRTLSRAGWSVAQASDGQQALDAMATLVPDVVVTDLMMPNVDGFELVARLRANPAYQHVPVLIVTARELTEDELRNLSRQVDRVLRKGERSREELLSEVMGVVARRTPQSAPNRTPVKL